MTQNKKLSRRITIGHTAETGKEIRKRVYGKSKTELERNIYLARREAELYAEKPMQIFQEFAKKWTELYKSQVEAKTIDMYREALKKTESIDNMPISLITSDNIQELINNHSAYPRACQKLAIVLNQIFDAAIEQELIRRNPVRKIVLPKYVPGSKRALRKDEISAIKNAELNPKQRMWMDMLYYFGLRPEEARALRKRSFDWAGNQVVIDQAIVWKNNKDVVIKSTKNHKIRRIPIPKNLAPSIKSYILECKTDFLFCNVAGEPFTEWEYRQFAAEILEKIYSLLEDTDSSDHMTFYTCRHNYATHLYYKGVVPGKISLKMAAYLMGHSETVFLRTYAHMDERLENVKDVVNNIEL